MTDIDYLKRIIIELGCSIPPYSSRKYIKIARVNLISTISSLITNKSERLVLDTNPDFYFIIRDLVPTIPDLRALETTKLMKLEKFDPWYRLQLELEGLGRDDKEGEEELELLNDII